MRATDLGGGEFTGEYFQNALGFELRCESTTFLHVMYSLAGLYSLSSLSSFWGTLQMPHLTAFHGAVGISYGVAPAPAISPLNVKFVEEMENTRDVLNQLHIKNDRSE